MRTDESDIFLKEKKKIYKRVIKKKFNRLFPPSDSQYAAAAAAYAPSQSAPDLHQ